MQRPLTPQPGDVVDGPRLQDVASTRHRAWHSHEQNVFYRNLILKAAPSTKSSDSSGIRGAAERIVDIIMIDKRGVFVKQVAQGGWIVMDRNAAVNKAQQAIRNCLIKAAEEEGGLKQQRQKKKRFKKKPPPAVRTAGSPKKPPAPKPPFFIYQAQAGPDTSIHPYALLLISAVCNQPKAEMALRLLDSPLSECFTNAEPPKERTMRLQVRAFDEEHCIHVSKE